ncbi:hypothetical protein [Rhizobium leguminosarum]|uniref:hypothetical protein n=1 Tax=Rhizobium leguminosarum TaxID=384 RepID=UPI0015FC2F3F|nr:hypothetical protein [Rhizobium leguminosarum]
MWHRFIGKGRSISRTVGYVVGLLMILLGLIWIAQGSGYFPYPSSSFMINQSIWVLWGSIMAVAGLAVTVIISRLRRRG